MVDYNVESRLSEKELAILYGELSSKKKSVFLTYALWFFFGSTGAHLFYIGRNARACIYLGLFLAMILASFVGLFFIPMGILGIFLIYDLFAIPSTINNQLCLTKTKIIQNLIASRPEPQITPPVDPAL